MFCSDDKHPDDLLLGHINQLCTRAVAKGIDVFKVLQMACLNPVKHYKLDVGTLKVGDKADFIVVEDLKDFKTLQTYIDGKLVYNNGDPKIPHTSFEVLNNFNTDLKQVSDFKVQTETETIKVIEALDGELVTNTIEAKPTTENGNLVSNTETDILKITVVNRYSNVKPATAFIKNFGLKQGAIASSVAHDSHNIIAVGVNDEELCKAVNVVIKVKGGVCTVSENKELVLPLPVAGIMSDQDAETVGKAYAEVDAYAKYLGCTLKAPFMTLSFMALLVIPSLKLSDKGLFDGNRFEFV
jgi:adenine deaminase